jgi:hypothetical protein
LREFNWRGSVLAFRRSGFNRFIGPPSGPWKASYPIPAVI